MKTVILGLGNTILRDDGVGIYVARLIEEMAKGRWSKVKVIEASAGGFNFIDLLAGYDRAVVVDAIHTKGGKPGEFYEIEPSILKPSARLSSLHGIDFATACQMARDMNIPFPNDVKIFVMEVEDEFTFSESCTAKVEEAIPKMAESIINELANAGWLE